MDDKVKKLLTDMILAIDNIGIHLGGRYDYKDFNENITIQSAIKYEFSVIGEAMNQLYKLVPDIKIHDVRKIIGLRNRMVHEYDAIDNAQLWNIVVNYLPDLKKDIENLLKE